MPEAARAGLPASFISDLHLTEDEPANVAAFLAFLQGPARASASLFILGDLFEYWAGDDDLETPFNARAATGHPPRLGHDTSRPARRDPTGQYSTGNRHAARSRHARPPDRLPHRQTDQARLRQEPL